MLSASLTGKVTRLVRTFRGARYQVTVKAHGFEYQGRLYTSLSEVARAITGANWNGWAFFGLRKKEKAS